MVGIIDNNASDDWTAELTCFNVSSPSVLLREFGRVKSYMGIVVCSAEFVSGNSVDLSVKSASFRLIDGSAAFLGG